MWSIRNPEGIRSEINRIMKILGIEDRKLEESKVYENLIEIRKELNMLRIEIQNIQEENKLYIEEYKKHRKTMQKIGNQTDQLTQQIKNEDEEKFYRGIAELWEV